MKQEEFYQKLSEHIELPFELEDVKEIDSNCGSTWIELHNGSIYYIIIDRSEPIDE